LVHGKGKKFATEFVRAVKARRLATDTMAFPEPRHEAVAALALSVSAIALV
jgi:hypothetical protein